MNLCHLSMCSYPVLLNWQSPSVTGLRVLVQWTDVLESSQVHHERLNLKLFRLKRDAVNLISMCP